MSQKRYASGTLTVTWDPQACIHSEKCWRGLGAVFRPGERPWINVAGAEDVEIAAQIDLCPSGALGYEINDPADGDSSPEAPEIATGGVESVSIRPTSDGPLEVLGEVTLLDSEGNEVRKASKLFLCRCGASKTKPFCDGSHKRIGFDSSS